MSYIPRVNIKNPLMKIFPTPSFLSMPSVGLSFSDTHIRFIEFVTEGLTAPIKLGDYATVELPKGVIVDGEIRDAEKLTEFILDLKKDFNFMYVRAALPEQKGYLYKTRVPYIEGEDIRDSVGFSIEENAPLPLAEAVFDYDIVRIDEAKKEIEVVVTVFPEAVIQQYVSVIESAYLTPLAFELEAYAVARAVVKRDDENAYIIVNHLQDKIGLYIVSHNRVHFTTTISLGDESISGVGGSFATQRLHPKEVEEEKREEKEAGMHDISLLKEEIHKLANYWISQITSGGHNKLISAVILCGVGVHTSGHKQALANAIEYPVRIANVWENVFSFEDYIPPIPSDEALVYAAAIGLALPDNR